MAKGIIHPSSSQKNAARNRHPVSFNIIYNALSQFMVNARAVLRTPRPQIVGVRFWGYRGPQVAHRKLRGNPLFLIQETTTAAHNMWAYLWVMRSFKR